LEQLEESDLVAGGGIGPIRLSGDFHGHLRRSDKARYDVKLRARGKHIGEIECYVAGP
jgi:hypothetical protein